MSLQPEVLNKDCMEAMKGFPDKFFDLAIVDPPYGINATNMQMGSAPNRVHKDGTGPAISTAVRLKGRLNSGSGKLKNRLLNKSEIGWDNEIPPPEYFKELFRISRDQIIWGGNYFPLPPCRGFVIWDKVQPWENFSQGEFAWTSFDVPAKIFSYSNRGGANDETKIHATQKPVKLYKYLIDRFALPNGYTKIIDTHLGSGSSRIAANDMGMQFWGYEVDEMHFIDQEKRFKNHIAQLTLSL